MQNVTLAGRVYGPVANSTMQHDILTCALLQRMGISDLAISAGEGDAAFRDRLMTKLLKGDELLPLLGHLMMPVDQPGTSWTPAMANETALVLANLHSSEEKAVLSRIIAEVVVFFCSVAIGSIMTSPRSSPLAANVVNLFRAAESATSGTGAHFFVR